MSNGTQQITWDATPKVAAPAAATSQIQWDTGGTPIKSETSLRPREGNKVFEWFRDLESDIRTGSDVTAPGRLLKSMGAKGTEAGVSKETGEFMGSPILGLTHMGQGAAQLPQHPYEGGKQIVSGALEAGTIPGMLAAGPSEAGASALAKVEKLPETYKAAKAARMAEKTTAEWQKINKVLGVSPKAVRIGEGAKGIEEAATMPGRSLEKAGFTAKQLAKMKPIERMKAIQPYVQAAGDEIQTALQTTEKSGKTLDVGLRATSLIKNIQNPHLQQAAIDTFNDLVKELGITNQRAATPTEAWKLRRALVPGARFGSGGDLNSLSTIRASLYGSVSGDLKDAVPALKTLDPLYSDLKEASKAARNAVAKEAAKGPPPTTAQKMLKKYGPWIAGAAGGASAVRAGEKIVKAFVPGGTQ